MSSKFGNIVQAKAEMGMTKDQLQDQKQAYMKQFMEKWNPANWGDLEEFKKKLKEIHKYISKAEADRYDADIRLKELNERQRQVQRNEAKAKGIDPNKYKPKIKVVTQYDRQIDRRNFKERKEKNSIAHFPNVPPPEVPLEKIIKKTQSEQQAEDDDEEDARYQRQQEEDEEE